jgi:hypothetical protein
MKAQTKKLSLSKETVKDLKVKSTVKAGATWVPTQFGNGC